MDQLEKRLRLGDPMPFRIEVRDTVNDKEEMRLNYPGLHPNWCTCEEDEFLCYPEDGACYCGVHKHHVHCAKCRGISQIG